MARRCYLKCFLIIVFICFSGKICFSASIDGILECNRYINLGNKDQQVVKLNIKKDGLYVIKSLGSNGVAMHLIDKNNEEIKPNFVEYDGNIFAIYLLNRSSYYANIRIKMEEDSEISKLGLYYLNDAVLIEETTTNGTINDCNKGEYYKYIPKDDDIYMIRSTGRINLRASIYDDKGMKIQESSNISGLNFKILEELKKDKCYYIRIYSTSDIGNFKLEVNKKQLRNKDIIDLEMDDDLNDDFCGYIKNGESNIKFISNVDGEYKLILISEMKLDIDVEDEKHKSIVRDCECNKNYSFATIDVEKGKEYMIKINNHLDKIGAYRLRLLNFHKLRRYAKDIIIGKNIGIISNSNEYLRFVCPVDGIFNFKNNGLHDIAIDFYDENGKLLKKAKKNVGVLKNIFGIRASKGDILYLKVSNNCCDFLEFGYEIEVNNFYELVMNCDIVSVGDVSGYVEEVGQKFFYKFIPRKSGVYFIKSKCNKFLDCKLYDVEGYLMQEEVKNLDFIIASKLKKGETYYININSINSIGEFNFEILVDDDTQKIKIQENVEIYNEIEYLGEVKQYEFCASEDAIYLPMVDSLTKIDIVKKDENGNRMEKMDLKKGEKCIIEVHGLDDIGSYCLKVENFTNKLKKATKVICNKEYQGNIIIPGIKNDYSFTPESSGYYSICTFGDLKMMSKVYDSKGDILVENKKEDDPNFCIVAKLEKGETYLITINEETGEETCVYVLGIEKNEKSETNPVWIKLNKIKFGLLSYDGEEKIYKIIISKKGRYFIDNYLSLDLNIEVSDENGDIIEKLNKCDISNRNLYELNENSLYYIKVQAKDKITTGMYSIKIQNLDEVYKSAKRLREDNIEIISKTRNGESYYYKLIVTYKDIYNILKVQGGRLYIELLDKEGNIIISDILNNSVNVKLDRGIYYLRCFSNSDVEFTCISYKQQQKLEKIWREVSNPHHLKGMDLQLSSRSNKINLQPFSQRENTHW